MAMIAERAAKRQCSRSVAALASVALSLAGCDFSPVQRAIDTTVQDAGSQIDLTISQLQSTSASWQQLLTQLQEKLTGDVKRLIGSDLQNLIDNSVAFAGAQLQCEADFLRQRIVEALIAIKAKLMGQPAPELEPRFCQAVPLAIDMALVPADVNSVKFYGFNFENRGNYSLKIEKLDGLQSDVTTALAIPTAYAMTVTLGPSGVLLGSTARRLLLYHHERLVSSVGIIQPQPVVRICQSRVDAPAKQQVGPLIPTKTRGDSDFDGHGPRVIVDASLTNTPREINLSLYMRARETKDDWTTVAARKDFVVYRAPAGYEIDRIASATSMHFDQVAAGKWDPKLFRLGEGGLVNSLQLVGDTDGGDVGRTQVRSAMMNPLQVVIHEVGDCQSPSAIGHLLGTRFLNRQLQARVAGAVDLDNSRLRTPLQRMRQR